MDKIYIEQMEIRTIIGTLEHERKAKQALILDIELHGDFSYAGKNDDLEYTVNYSEVEEKVMSLVQNSSFKLIEALAEAVAQLCLSFEMAKTVKVKITKPGAAKYARNIALKISRSR